MSSQKPLYQPETRPSPPWLGLASFFSPGPRGSLLTGLPSQALPQPPAQNSHTGACHPLQAPDPSLCRSIWTAPSIPMPITSALA